MTNACVTVALDQQPCTVWSEPACGQPARWTIERRVDNCTTAVHHACPTHLADGLDNTLGIPGPQRAVDCLASTPTGFGQRVAICSRPRNHFERQHRGTLPDGQVYLWC